MRRHASGRTVSRGDSLFLRLVIPESDTVVTALSRHRFAGSTTPGAAVRLNGRPLKVYPSGAIAGLMDLEVGENAFLFTASNGRRDTVRKTLFIVRTPPLAFELP